MNIDKFGHHVHKRLRRSYSFDPDDVLTKTENGEFDLRYVRLTGVKYPLDKYDVVNKEYVDNLINRQQEKETKLIDFDKVLTKSEEGVFDLNSTRLKGVKYPSANDDAVNKQYVDTVMEHLCTEQQLIANLNNFKAGISLLISKQLDKYYTKLEIDFKLNSHKNE